jgi:serine/threonine-protein phosphatase 2A activator
MVLSKKILTKNDLENFHSSVIYEELLTFIHNLSESVKNLTVDSVMFTSYSVNTFDKVMQRIQDSIQLFPVTETKSRFGNASFRDWISYVRENSSKWIEEELGIINPEVSEYLNNSFGDFNRIDYGTGHELNFIVMLFVLEKLNFFISDDYPLLVLQIFNHYIQVMRELQFKYWLEPAGSHGVWGLDDYHFLPFLFGAYQLHDHKYIKPKSIHNDEIVCEYSSQYMYLSCIKFINQIKTESLVWHSPMLNDISGVKTWAKVASGLEKMYKAEVLGKLPIMQHFLFCELLGFFKKDLEENDVCEHGQDDVIYVKNHSGIPIPVRTHSHVYALGQEKPTCCGVRIPSSIASQKRIPFD